MTSRIEMKRAAEIVGRMAENGKSRRDCYLVRDIFVEFFESLNPRFDASQFYIACNPATDWGTAAAKKKRARM